MTIEQKTSSEEIVMLEKSIGGDPEKALRNRRVRRAITTIRLAWVEEPGRAQADLHNLLIDQAEWRWPLKVYNTEEIKATENNLRKELSKNQSLPLSVIPAEAGIQRFKRFFKKSNLSYSSDIGRNQ